MPKIDDEDITEDPNEQLKPGEGEEIAGEENLENGDGEQPQEPTDMLSAIEQGLKKEETPGEEEKPGEKPGEKKELTPEEKAGKELQKTAEEFDPKDPYKIPSNKILRGEGRKAYTQLVNYAKEKDTIIHNYQGLEQTVNSFQAAVREAQAQPEQIVLAMEFIKAFNTGNHKRALELVEIQRKELARVSGVSLPGLDINTLSEFPDLVKQVENLEITQAAADEIAKLRREAKLRQEREQQQTVEAQQQSSIQQQAEQSQREVGTAMAQIQQYIEDKRKTDINFKSKDKVMAPKMQALLAGVPPKYWLSKIQIYYDSITVAANPGNGKGRNEIMRPTGQQGGGGKPGTMQDAISEGLGYNLS